MKSKVFLFVVLAVAVFGSNCLGALNAYLKLEGETQGEILGSVTQAGREDLIMVIAFSHSITASRDPNSGMPTGNQSHGTVMITKEIDKATPLLMAALVGSERMTLFELRFWQPSTTGQEVQYYSIILYDARIVSIQQEMLNNKYPENMQHKEREHISFVYGSVEKIWEDGGISSQADWTFDGSAIFVSDLNGDGFVNLIDLAILAGEWMQPGS